MCKTNKKMKLSKQKQLLSCELVQSYCVYMFGAVIQFGLFKFFGNTYSSD